MAYQQLTILHVSDVHTSFDNIHKLQQWIEANNQNLDMILVSGDIADMPMEYGFDESDEALLFKKSYYDDMLKVVDAIAKIHGRVYYIPGNHDVPQAFITTASDSPSGPLNVHLQTIPVASGLSLAGLGGSVPGYKEGKHLWDGFPYTSEDLIQKDLMQLLDPLVKDGSTDQFILMTHVGPISSGMMSLMMCIIVSISRDCQ
jgi:Icc-related predicted phosphoesterase